MSEFVPSKSASRRRATVVQSVARRAVLGRLATLAHGQVRVVDVWLGGSEAAEVHELGSTCADFPHAVVLTVHDPAFYSAITLRGSVGAAEAFMDGHWSVSDLATLMRLMVRNRSALDGLEGGLARLSQPLLALFHRLRDNTRKGSRRNIAAHYDLGNAFFERFLDPTLTYSSGVFASRDTSMEDASTAKLDRLCRKLALQATDHVLEIGTGWGSFALHAAKNYGCRVTTTTISAEQHALATERVRRAGLEHRVEVLLSDYRDLTGSFDKVVSVEMVEAVGHRHLETYMRACSERLKPDGAMAMQVITMADQHYDRALREVDFIKRYIFPGSFIPSMNAISSAMTNATDLRIAHLEDFGTHYAETLRRWADRFEAARDEIRAMGYPDEFLRMWEYYLRYCEGGFDERFISVAQVVFTKPACRLAPILPALDGLPELRASAV